MGGGGGGYSPVFLRGKTLLCASISNSHSAETQARSKLNTVM